MSRLRSPLARRAVQRPMLAALSLVCALALVQGGPTQPASASPGAADGTSVVTAAAAAVTPLAAARKKKGGGWTPPPGALFNTPYAEGGRTLTNRVVKAIRNTPKGETIRMIIWNIDDPAITNNLIRANRRGVNVQVLTSHSTQNSNWNKLARNVRGNGSFARKCKGACRSGGPTVHQKIITISRIRKVEGIVMVGSLNLTKAGAARQWNDLMTFRDKRMYNFFVARFNESRKDKPVRQPYRVANIGNNQITMYPARNRNPILAQLNQVRCTGAAQGYGNGRGRTVIRVAVAGWFDIYGETIAKKLRRLWEQGCDIKAVVTLAGRGINRAFKATSGRGPIPLKKLTVDDNGDGVPDKYLHMKAMSINGVFGKDRSAAVVVTGSPNWSENGRRSDEVNVRIGEAKGIMLAYQRQISRLFNARAAHYRTGTTRAEENLDYSDPNSPFELN